LWDGGVIGKEDDAVLKPALKKIFKRHISLWSFADGFGSGQYENDAVIATYHDQG
jgi:4-hydroxythreonine-4-phosphate dehydrogenase